MGLSYQIYSISCYICILLLFLISASRCYINFYSLNLFVIDEFLRLIFRTCYLPALNKNDMIFGTFCLLKFEAAIKYLLCYLFCISHCSWNVAMIVIAQLIFASERLAMDSQIADAIANLHLSEYK